MRLVVSALTAAAIFATPAAASDPDSPGERLTGPKFLFGGDPGYKHYNVKTRKAKDELSFFYRQGDVEGAISHLIERAQAGEIWAMMEMGALYSDGVHVAPDAEKALGWYFEAAIRGNAEAMLTVGAAFAKGVGVEQDTELAEAWLDRASDKGNYKIKRDAQKLRRALT